MLHHRTHDLELPVPRENMSKVQNTDEEETEGIHIALLQSTRAFVELLVPDPAQRKTIMAGTRWAVLKTASPST